MFHCPLFDCLVYGGCFIICYVRPCQRCPSSPFHKSPSCHDGVAFIIRLWFCRPGLVSSWGALVVAFSLPLQWKMGGQEKSAVLPCLCNKATLKLQCLGIWTHDASPPSSASKPCLRKRLIVSSWNRKWSWNDQYNCVRVNWQPG